MQYTGADTAFHGYEHLVCEHSKVTAIYVDGSSVATAKAGDDVPDTAELQLADEGNMMAVHVDHSGTQVDAKGGAPKWRFVNALAFLKFYGRGAANSLETDA